MNSPLRLMRAFGVALLLMAGIRSSALADTRPAIEDHSITVNGVTLHYLQAGSGTGTPVLLLHGFGETSRMWVPLMQRLARDRVVIAPDLPGAGASSIPASGYDKKTMAQDVHAMVAALGYSRVEVVGHDIGLMVAYAYAAQYPQQTASLTLMESFLPGVGPSEAPQQTMALLEAFLRAPETQ